LSLPNMFARWNDARAWEDGLANAAVSTWFAVYYKSRQMPVTGLDYS
jgi:hypothetical protein